MRERPRLPVHVSSEPAAEKEAKQAAEAIVRREEQAVRERNRPTLSPELKRLLALSWKRNEAGYRYLANNRG